jgi:EmrB/QacA subfamily drug resistance transporter
MKEKHNGDAAHVNAVVFVIVLTSFIPAIAGSILNVAIPAIGIGFGSSASSLGWIVNAFTIAVLVVMLPLGRLADLTSKRVILITGLFVFGGLNALACFSVSLEMVIALRVLQAFGAAAMFATSQAILVDTVPAHKRGRALGMSVASVYAGLAIGPLLGGVITQYMSWRWIFAFAGALGLITAFVTLVKLPKKPVSGQPERKREKGKLLSQMDIGGSALYMVGTGALAVGLNLVKPGVWWPFAVVLAGLALLVGFVLRENSAETPLISMELFKGKRNFLFSNIAALLNYAATFAVNYLLAIYLQLVMGFGADVAGLILVSCPVVQTVVSIIAGRLSDKKSPYMLASLGMSLCAAGLISFIFVGENTPLWHIILNLACLGVGFGFFSSPNTNAIMSLSEPKDRGIVSSLIATMRNFGMAFSMCAITIITNANLGATLIEDASPSLIVSVMRTAFIIFSALCVVGALISSNRKSVGAADRGK